MDAAGGHGVGAEGWGTMLDGRDGRGPELRRNPRYARFPQTWRVGGSIPVTLVEADQGAHELVDPPVPLWVAGLALEADMPVSRNVGDGWTAPRRTRGGDIALAPPGTEVAWRCGGPHRVLIASLPEAPVAELIERTDVVDGARSLDPLGARCCFRDERVRTTLVRLWLEASRADPSAALLVDALAQLLVAELLRLASPARPRPAHRLSAGELARVEAFVAEHLEDRIDIAALAGAAGVSPARFARRFRASTGSSPYRYVTRQRMERAQSLLARTADPLAEIARACGFSSQSHFGSAFRKHVGTSPARFRERLDRR